MGTTRRVSLAVLSSKDFSLSREGRQALRRKCRITNLPPSYYPLLRSAKHGLPRTANKSQHFVKSSVVTALSLVVLGTPRFSLRRRGRQ